MDLNFWKAVCPAISQSNNLIELFPIIKSFIKKLEPIVFFKSGVNVFLIYLKRSEVFPTASGPKRQTLNLY